MKPITLELPDKIAALFEALPNARKKKIALLAATLTASKPSTWEDLFLNVDKRVEASGLTSEEIDQMLDELS